MNNQPTISDEYIAEHVITSTDPIAAFFGIMRELGGRECNWQTDFDYCLGIAWRRDVNLQQPLDIAMLSEIAVVMGNTCQMKKRRSHWKNKDNPNKVYWDFIFYRPESPMWQHVYSKDYTEWENSNHDQ